MERETGIEPAPSAWKAEVLPLNYSRAARNLTHDTWNWWREVDDSARCASPSGPCLRHVQKRPPGASVEPRRRFSSTPRDSPDVLPQTRGDTCVEAGGGRWIRTTEGVSQQIYSLPPLAAWVSLRICNKTRETARYFDDSNHGCQRGSIPGPKPPRQARRQPAKRGLRRWPFSLADPAAQAQTLNRKCSTSPSFTRYSLPSSRNRPTSRAPDSPRYWMKSS